MDFYLRALMMHFKLWLVTIYNYKHIIMNIIIMVIIKHLGKVVMLALDHQCFFFSPVCNIQFYKKKVNVSL